MRNLITTAKMVKDSLVALSYKETNIVPQLGYEETVRVLNSLQTNAALLQEYKKRGQATHSVQAKNLDETIKYLTRSGVSLKQLDKLSVIHVAGTKGKGSTCAFCESVLRQHGIRTGFYSSPHLIAVRERIRINGAPLSQQDFTKYFWNVYNKLDARKEDKGDMPPYFKFLTVMAFNVFLAEKVDVAIIEVGIGGEYDCTNILREVGVVGITSLGMDHTSLLGNTIEEIAWQKAGIMKPGSIVFTSQQPQAALEVLKTRALEKQCFLYMVPPLANYNWSKCSLELGPRPKNQTLNASLALQLANAWMLKHSCSTVTFEELAPSCGATVPLATLWEVTPAIAQGLKQCSWPGRTQLISCGTLHYFLDGAHTKESMIMCAQWFNKTSQQMSSTPQSVPRRVLVFNATGDRSSSQLLSPLTACGFQEVIFCPNMTSVKIQQNSDQTNNMVTSQQSLERCQHNEQAWLSLPGGGGTVIQFSCVGDVFSHLQSSKLETHVLVTGSLHLVGSALSLLDPNLEMPTSL